MTARRLPTDDGRDEYLDAAERDRLGLPDPPGRTAAFAVSIAALLLVCAVLLAGGLGR